MASSCFDAPTEKSIKLRSPRLATIAAPSAVTSSPRAMSGSSSLLWDDGRVLAERS
jgi:hypothetical protein